MKKIIENYTYAVQCFWCHGSGPVKYLKISPKKEKPACLFCYNMMVQKPEFKVDLEKPRIKRWLEYFI